MIRADALQFAEILPYERYKLYEWIYTIAPSHILEVGTGYGGSTYCMAESIKDLNIDTKIYTCDPRRHPSQSFFETYPFVIYYKTESSRLISDLLRRKIPIDFIFFDGPADPNVALLDLQRMEEHIKVGTHFCMHDWETTPRGHDGATSTKSLTVRPYVEQSPRWKLIEVLSGLKKNSMVNNDTFDSVGLCLYQFVQ